VRTLPAGQGQGARLQLAVRELDDRVGAALAGISRVPRNRRAQRLDGSAQDSAALRVENTVEGEHPFEALAHVDEAPLVDLRVRAGRAIRIDGKAEAAAGLSELCRVLTLRTLHQLGTGRCCCLGPDLGDGAGEHPRVIKPDRARPKELIRLREHADLASNLGSPSRTARSQATPRSQPRHHRWSTVCDEATLALEVRQTPHKLGFKAVDLPPERYEICTQDRGRAISHLTLDNHVDSRPKAGESIFGGVHTQNCSTPIEHTFCVILGPESTRTQVAEAEREGHQPAREHDVHGSAGRTSTAEQQRDRQRDEGRRPEDEMRPISRTGAGGRKS